MRRCACLAAIALLFAPSAHGLDWAVTYEADVLPTEADPAWTQANYDPAQEGTTTVSNGVLTLTDRMSWDIEDHPIMDNPAAAFLYNDPTDGLSTWEMRSGRVFSIEFRMRVNAYPAGVKSTDAQVGVKLEFQGARRPWVVSTQRAAQQMWLAAEQRAWHFQHASDDPSEPRWVADKTGDELFATLAGLLREAVDLEVDF